VSEKERLQRLKVSLSSLEKVLNVNL